MKQIISTAVTTKHTVFQASDDRKVMSHYSDSSRVQSSSIQAQLYTAT